MYYHVMIKPSGHEFQIAEDEAILDAALREKGNVLPYGCRNGTCGSCMGTATSRMPSLYEAEMSSPVAPVGNVKVRMKRP